MFPHSHFNFVLYFIRMPQCLIVYIFLHCYFSFHSMNFLPLHYVFIRSCLYLAREFWLYLWRGFFSACHVTDCAGCWNDITDCEWCKPGTGKIIDANNDTWCQRKFQYKSIVAASSKQPFNNIWSSLYIVFESSNKIHWMESFTWVDEEGSKGQCMIRFCGAATFLNYIVENEVVLYSGWAYM